MIKLVTLLLLYSLKSHATTLQEAISSVAKEGSANELVVESESYESSLASAKQTMSSYVPTPYLFYTYSKPFEPVFEQESANTSFPRQFITGFTQKNYGFAVDYNIASLPQAIKKLQSVSVTKSAAKSTMDGKKSEFYYALANIYIELYRAEATFDLQRKIYETAKARYAEIQKNTQYGMTSRKDSLLSESELMQAEMNLESYQNLLKNAQAKYQEKFQVLHTNLQLSETPLLKIAKNVDELKEKIASNQNVNSLNQIAKSYRIESSIEKFNLLPKVTLTYRHTFNNPDSTIGIPNYVQGSFAINANFNLLNINDYFASKKYSHEEKKKKAEAKLLKNSYETEALNLWNDTKHQEELIVVLAKVTQNAKEIYNITKTEVRSGTKSFIEELRTKQDYNTAELNLIEAKLKRMQNIQRLKFLTGAEMFV